jgi:hypothetical protein
MARTGIAETTIVDISDGVNPVSVFLDNENHTFAASETGVVSDVNAFSSTLQVFVGQVKATYNTNLLNINTFKYTDVSYVGSATGWGAPTYSTTTGKITIPSISSDHSSSAIIRITFSVKNSLGGTVSGLTKDITLAIAQSGAGGQVINLAAESNGFFAGPDGTLDSGQDDSDISITKQGLTGNYSFFTSLNGESFAQQMSTSTEAGGISAYSTNGSTFSTGTISSSSTVALRISPGNLGNGNNTLTVRVTGAVGGSDFVTFYAIKKGDEGESALVVAIQSDNGTTFKNNDGPDKTLTCKVYDAKDGSEITSGVTYTWKRNNGAAVYVNNSTDREVQPFSSTEATGTDYSSIVVGAGDVDESETFSCQVSVA